MARTFSKKIRRYLSADPLHKTLAIVSAVFLSLMSLSGVGLAVKAPYYENVYYEGSMPQSAPPQSIGAILDRVAEQSDTIIAIYGETKTMWVADTIQNEKRTSYVIHPVTGDFIAPFEALAVFDFVRTLHTRLLLDDRGRAFTFLASLCMVILCITGIQKLARKKGGYKKIFRPTPSDTVSKKLHTTVGIFVGIPLFILGFTGAYTAVQSIFKIQYETVITGDLFESNPDNNTPEQKKSYGQMASLQTLSVRDIKTVTLPAPDDAFDVITITMADKIIYLDQYTGDVLSTELYRPMGRIHNVMLTIHRTNDFWLWLIIWMISALCVPLFIITGFIVLINRKRPKRKPKKPIG